MGVVYSVGLLSKTVGHRPHKTQSQILTTHNNVHRTSTFPTNPKIPDVPPSRLSPINSHWEMGGDSRGNGKNGWSREEWRSPVTGE